MAEQKAEKRRPIFISLRLKLLVAFLLLFGALAGGIFYWFYTFSHDLVTRRFHDFVTQAAMDRLQEDLQTLLVGVSAQIDGDQFEQLVNDPQLATLVTQTEEKPGAGIYPDDQRYWDHVKLLGQVYQIDPRTGLYTYVAGDKPGEVVYIGSSGATKPERSGAKFRQVDQFSPSDAAVILGGLKGTTFYLQIYQDQFGKWISGYTPIKDSSGKTVGALGIDFRAEYVERVQHDLQERIVSDVQQKVRTGIILATGITSIVVILMVFLISGVLTRPITALTRVAGHIGEGDYAQDLSGLTPGRFSDEIGTLAQVFEIMVGKVRQREEKLKKQVIELQIMIDEGKRQEQVEEIVDSDFFRDLQQKARKMRQGFASSSASTPPKSDK
jgi:HAMP domain-containing protein